MKVHDIKKLKLSGQSIDKKRSFFMPLVYFNGAKESVCNFNDKIKEFELVRDWFTRNIKELEDFCSANEGREVTPEIMSYFDQWSEGCRLDVEGAMEEMHSPLAESLRHYFNFLTYCVASVESCTNQEIAKLLHSGDLKEDELEKWKPLGIGCRPRHLLEWKARSELKDAELLSTLEIFQKVVKCQNNFVHYKTRPVTFTYNEFDIANVVGDKNANIEFCSIALASVCKILNHLVGDDQCLTFETSFLGFQPGWSPSPYINFHY